MAEADEMQDELEDRFSAAADFLKTVAGKLVPEQLLEFYAYYKQATVGRCSTQRPSWYQVEAKQKWDAWDKLGDMTTEQAMESYIHAISKVDPDWEKGGGRGGEHWIRVSSLLNRDEHVEEHDKNIFDYVKEGNTCRVKELLVGGGINVDELDESGLGAIHWAADRGNLQMVQLLVCELDADIELKDNEGQTAMHYAASCGHADVIKFLIGKCAKTDVKDCDGIMPIDAAADEIKSLFT